MRDPSQLFQQAADLHLKGKLAPAEGLYRELLAAQPGHFHALHFLGVLQYQQGRWSEALASIGAALGANPDFPPALVSCAAVLRALDRPAEALARLDRALAIKPDYVEALMGRGSALRGLKRPGEALASFDRALAIKPDFADGHVSRGNTLRDLDRPNEALASFERALAIKGDHVGALVGRGSALRKLGRAEEAIACLNQALAIKPDHADALIHRGNAAQHLKRPRDALASYEMALAIRPDDVDALINRGNALRDLKRPAEALASYEQALAINPRHAGALYNRGNALADLQRPAEALASFDQALAIMPDHAEALTNRAGALRSLGRPAEALAGYEEALAIKPDHADALYNRGNALTDLQRPAEALASFDQALAIRQDYAAALNNRAGVLRSLGRPAEALASLERALAIDPDNAETRYNQGCAQLLLGDFDHGWRDYEWRWKTPDQADWRRNFAQPLWLGEASLEGRTILLHAEQGFGDAIQFVRYVPLVAARAGRVILEVQPQLKSLLARIDGASLVIGRGETPPDFDCHCPLASLPLAFGTRLETIPPAVPYLSAAEERAAKWQARLTGSGPRIGIAWAGNPGFRGDATRSIGLARLAPLLATPGVAFFGLQKDLRAGDRDFLQSQPALVHLGDAIEDFEDTAAIVSLLDLVISSDTSIVHLAGALSKPVWILLQCAADWRWLTDRADNPWYPTARLFRQPAVDDWESVVQQVGGELEMGVLPVISTQNH
jgi:tetratricopeptide (TPR) repeat protein